MPFKMKGFPMIQGTGAMKAMKESAMKKMHASPKKAMKDPMKKMKDPMKAMKDPMKAMHASPKKIMKGGAKKDPNYYKKGNFMDTKKSEQERIDKKAYGPEGAPATVKPKKGRDTLTTAIPQSTIGKKMKKSPNKIMKGGAKSMKDKVAANQGKPKFKTKSKISAGTKESAKRISARAAGKTADSNIKRGTGAKFDIKKAAAKKAMEGSPKKAMSPKKKNYS